MTASWSDRSLVGISLLLAACRGGLPAEPPGHDAADARAPTKPYAPPPNPYERSAWGGVSLDAGGGHEHMNHGAKPEPSTPVDEATEAKPHAHGEGEQP